VALLAREVSAADFASSMAMLRDVSKHVSRFLETYDLLLTPTLARPPPLIGELLPRGWRSESRPSPRRPRRRCS
jgi:amidase